jgi:16S rRNA (cytidine1402-2'-O)-methyltransferase
VSELLAHYTDEAPRGEIVLVLGAAEPGRMDRERALGAVRDLVAAGARPRAAASAVASLSGHGANELYRALTAAHASG